MPQLYVRTDFTSVLYSFVLVFLLTLSPLIQMFCSFASAAVERRFLLLMSSSSPISVPTFFAFLYSLPDLDSVVCSVLSALTCKLYFFNVFCTSAISLSLLISLSLGETLLLEPFDGKVYDLLPVFLPELWSCPSNHLCLAPIFWLVFLSLSFRLS